MISAETVEETEVAESEKAEVLEAEVLETETILETADAPETVPETVPGIACTFSYFVTSSVIYSQGEIYLHCPKARGHVFSSDWNSAWAICRIFCVEWHM